MMLSNCRHSLFACLALLGVFSGVTEAASSDDDRIRMGNHTIDRTVQLRTHSLYAPYIDQDLQNRWWDFGADSYVNTNKHIRLTRPVPSQMGWLWSRLPITASNYVIEVEFKVSGESSHLFGDGMAVWLTKERAKPGPIFGNENKFDGLGIMLDTYANSRHAFSFPRINGFLGDGKTEYDFASDGETTTIGACSSNFRRTNVATKLKVTYVKDSFLDVKVQSKAWDEWIDCFHVEGISLPPAPYLGFSAMTGDVVDAHDIISITTSSAILSKADAQGPKNKKKFGGMLSSSSEEGGSWFGFFFKLILLGGVCAGGFYGYKEYQRRYSFAGSGNFGGLGGGNFGSNSYNSKRF
ncbi:hypothetical protein HGRIS_001917 [Hohenbuehelia grisea]|uniref:L-type lectin-like domain-containing protein n=1 Tax=Hohenbuehelia grisea TaxID=104357 RepID=A0ABR3JJN6_9AGAR